MRSAARGFTLIEVIVALVIFGTLTVALAQGLRFGLLAWNTATRLTDAGDSFDIVDRTLRNLIGHMDPGNETTLPQISASSGTLSFITRLPERPGVPVRRVEALLAVDLNHRLVLRWRPYLHAERLRPAVATETELLRNVARMELFFWNPEGGWTEGWRQAEGVPSLVRVRLTMQPPQRRHWPDIVVAPELDRP
jgi:general secretion pathway protein J